MDEQAPKRIGRLPNDGREYKFCVDCKEEKPLSQFPRTSSGGYLKYRNRCRPCYNMYCLMLPKRVAQKVYPDEMICKICSELKPREEFYSSGRGFLRPECKSCFIRLKSEEKSASREFYRSRGRVEYRELRLYCLEQYGNRCVCCGEEEEIFLAFDHVNNDGAAHRKVVGKTSVQMLKWVVINDFPDVLQILCWNCNWAKAKGGCPHQNSIVTNV